MVIRTYFDKNNTIVSNSIVNTGLNPVAELFYGGADGAEKYSRFLFYFDENSKFYSYKNNYFTFVPVKLTCSDKLLFNSLYKKMLIEHNISIIKKINEQTQQNINTHQRNLD